MQRPARQGGYNCKPQTCANKLKYAQDLGSLGEAPGVNGDDVSLMIRVYRISTMGESIDDPQYTGFVVGLASTTIAQARINAKAQRRQ